MTMTNDYYTPHWIREYVARKLGCSVADLKADGSADERPEWPDGTTKRDGGKR